MDLGSDFSCFVMGSLRSWILNAHFVENSRDPDGSWIMLFHFVKGSWDLGSCIFTFSGGPGDLGYVVFNLSESMTEILSKFFLRVFECRLPLLAVSLSFV